MNLGQDTLFGKKTIQSVGYDEQEIIKDILYLHCDGASIDCDPTYSIGNFYKDGLQKPKYKFDLNPQLPEVTQADVRKLPLADNSINILMFDPPFVIGGITYTEADEGSCIIPKRFMQFESFDELKEMYSQSLKEFSRIVAENGIIIFKCQDCVASAKQYFSHCWIMYEAIKFGFYPKDLFIYAVKNRMISVTPESQQHARKFHSYFWVFEKRKSKVNYS